MQYRIGACVGVFVFGASLASCGGPPSDEAAEDLGELDSALSPPLNCQPAYLGGTPSASSNPGTVSQGFDGSTRSGGWQAATTGVEWFEVDLGDVRRLDGFLVAWSLPSSDFDFQYRDAGGAWQTARTFSTTGAPNTIFEVVDLDVRARYVRVLSRRSYSATQGVILSELELVGDNVAACTTTYRIDSVHSGKSLDMTDWATWDGGRLQQWGYHGGNNQRWELHLTNARRVAEFGIEPQYELKNVHSGKCVDIDGPTTSDGGKMHQWTCYDLTSQRFTLEDAGNGERRLRSVYSGKCLDVEAWGTADGAKLIQWPCHSGANQRFTFKAP